MKKLLLLLLFPILAFGQTNLYNTLDTSSVRATTQNPYDNSTLVATDQFVLSAVRLSMSTVPLSNVTGGTYNFGSIGTGAVIVAGASGGVINSIVSIAVPGTGYQVGDCLTLANGNYDSVLRVTAVSSGGITAMSILYGGTGNGAISGGLPVNSAQANVPFKYTLAGVLASNATFIMTSGSYLVASNQWIIGNNTTGAFTTTFKISNGSGGSTGTGVVVSQGTSNSANTFIETDGSTDIWLAAPAANSSGGSSSWSSLTAPTVSNSVTATVDTSQTLQGHFDTSASLGQALFTLSEDAASTKAGAAGSAPKVLFLSTFSGSNSNPITVQTQGILSFYISKIGSFVFSGLSDAVTTSGGTGATFTGGASASANAAGSMSIIAGANSSSGAGGNVVITPGTSSSGTAGIIQLGGPIADGSSHLFMSNTAPTITSGFGTSPTITANNTGAFKVAIGTTPGTTGVLAMPTASNGWVCDAHDVTTTTETVDLTASSASSVTLTFYGRTTGTATAPTAADVILIKCMAY